MDALLVVKHSQSWVCLSVHPEPHNNTQVIVQLTRKDHQNHVLQAPLHSTSDDETCITRLIVDKPSSSTGSGSPWDLAWERGIFQDGCCVGTTGHCGASGPQVVNALVFLWPQHLLCGR